MRDVRAATYDDYVRAERAVARLDAEGIAATRTVVIGRDWRLARVSPRRPLVERAERGAIAGGAASVATIAAAAVVGPARFDVALAALAVVIGALAGAAAAGAWSLWSDRATNGARLVPAAWDVVCLGAARDVDPSHVLARWWDPTVPTGPQTPAGAKVRAA